MDSHIGCNMSLWCYERQVLEKSSILVQESLRTCHACEEIQHDESHISQMHITHVMRVTNTNQSHVTPHIPRDIPPIHRFFSNSILVPLVCTFIKPRDSRSKNVDVWHDELHKVTLVDIYYVLQVTNLGLLLCQLSTCFPLAIMYGEVAPCIYSYIVSYTITKTFIFLLEI
jgi:hypothetical protein